MRIAIVTRRYWPAIGGVERVAMNLGETLAARGHEVRVIAQCVDEGRFGRMTHIIRENQRFAPFQHDGVNVVQFRPTRPRRTLLLPFALELIPLMGRLSQRRLRRHSAAYYAAVVEPVLSPLLAGVDVVHVLGGEVMAYAAVRAAARAGIPSAISPFAHPGDWGFDSGSIRAYREADAVIATTRADAAVYRGAGVDPARLRVVALPVPPIVRRAAAGDPLPVPDGAPLVVFLGARRPTKGVELLLAAAPHVWARHPETRFAFVGPGDPLGSADARILDVGRVEDDERGRWLARAQLLCLPSSSESFGMVVGEAWSESVPVVVSDIPVLRELVEDSGGGLVAARTEHALAEAISSLLADPGEARSRGARGQQFWRSQLAPEAVCDRHLEIYEELLPVNPRAASQTPPAR
ncbi:MAG TPA: glycosyltransferase family 4 protein [Solirubrobacteraceae bacterium]|nr:glycosyltransferase family 4 protein [Solirubrobacteraceae bacterium]